MDQHSEKPSNFHPILCISQQPQFAINKNVIFKNYYGFVATPKLIIEHVKISNLNLTKGSYLMYFSGIEVYLKGLVIIKYIESYSDKFTIINTPGPLSLQFENYVEISYCTIPIAFKISFIYIAENATVNFTMNTFDTLIFNKEYQLDPETLISSSRMLKPCIFQYSSSRGNLYKEFEDGKNFNVFNYSNDIGRLSRYKCDRILENQS